MRQSTALCLPHCNDVDGHADGCEHDLSRPMPYQSHCDCGLEKSGVADCAVCDADHGWNRPIVNARFVRCAP